MYVTVNNWSNQLRDSDKWIKTHSTYGEEKQDTNGESRCYNKTVESNISPGTDNVTVEMIKCGEEKLK